MHLVICVGSVRRILVQNGISSWNFSMDFWVGYGAGAECNRTRSPINQLEASPCSMHNESNAFHARLIQLSESM